MEIEFQLSKKAYFESAKLHLQNSLQKRSWIFILLIIFAFFPLSGDTFIWWRFLTALVAAPMIVLLVFYGIPLIILLFRVNKALQKDSSGLEEKRITITEEGLSIASASKTTVRKWESIVSAYSNEKFIYIALADKRYVPFPKSSFVSDNEAVNFLGTIQSRIFQFRGVNSVTMYPGTKKPDYRLGLICIIPLIGAVAGLVFIINGIFKYKDKWLIIIGVAGIVWTVGIYGSLFYSMTTIGFKNAFVPQSQRQLNSVMKAVEFYKVRNGTYPDSLKQINDDNSETWIYDPIEPKRDFNYQKVGNHYYLFSSGLDGIPNTKDDIYPQVAKSDSGKFGLIVKRP